MRNTLPRTALFRIAALSTLLLAAVPPTSAAREPSPQTVVKAYRNNPLGTLLRTYDVSAFVHGSTTHLLLSHKRGSTATDAGQLALTIDNNTGEARLGRSEAVKGTRFDRALTRLLRSHTLGINTDEGVMRLRLSPKRYGKSSGKRTDRMGTATMLLTPATRDVFELASFEADFGRHTMKVDRPARPKQGHAVRIRMHSNRSRDSRPIYTGNFRSVQRSGSASAGTIATWRDYEPVPRVHGLNGTR